MAYGASANSDIASALSPALNISEIVPPAFVNGEDPKNPPMKRKINMVSIFLAAAHPV